MHESMRDKNTWEGSGRATIDPSHSPQVEGDHYLTATTPRSATPWTPSPKTPSTTWPGEPGFDIIRWAWRPGIAYDLGSEPWRAAGVCL